MLLLVSISSIRWKIEEKRRGELKTPGIKKGKVGIVVVVIIVVLVGASAAVFYSQQHPCIFARAGAPSDQEIETK